MSLYHQRHFYMTALKERIENDEVLKEELETLDFSTTNFALRDEAVSKQKEISTKLTETPNLKAHYNELKLQANDTHNNPIVQSEYGFIVEQLDNLRKNYFASLKSEPEEHELCKKDITTAINRINEIEKEYSERFPLFSAVSQPPVFDCVELDEFDEYEEPVYNIFKRNPRFTPLIQKVHKTSSTGLAIHNIKAQKANFDLAKACDEDLSFFKKLSKKQPREHYILRRIITELEYEVEAICFSILPELKNNREKLLARINRGGLFNIVEKVIEIREEASEYFFSKKDLTEGDKSACKYRVERKFEKFLETYKLGKLPLNEDYTKFFNMCYKSSDKEFTKEVLDLTLLLY